MDFKRFAAAVTAVAAFCLIALSACSGGKDTSNDRLAQIKDKGEITIALEGTWAPWGYHDENDELVGYDVEIGKKIAEKLGIKKVNFVEGEWSGLLAGLEGGRYDMMINGIDVDEDRKEKYDFSTPYAYNRTAVIVRAGDDSIQSMEDLNGKTTANTLQSTYAIVAEGYGATVTPVDDFIQTIELLTSNRIDATLNAEVSFYDYLNTHPDAPVKIACIDPKSTEVAIAMPKGAESDALREAVDKALAEMTEDGTLTGLSQKYFDARIGDISKK